MSASGSTQAVPLHLTSLAILSPNNAPLYVHSFTGEDDELRAYHLAHGAVDVIEERIVMTSSPNRPADSYLGLLFCMEDMAFYGFQTPTKLRMVLSVALVDAAVKDSDVVAIFRAVHQLLLRAVNNPFLSLPASFTAKPAPPEEGTTQENGAEAARSRNEPVPDDSMFRYGPEDLKADWLARSSVFTRGIDKLGSLLAGPKAGPEEAGKGQRQWEARKEAIEALDYMPIYIAFNNGPACVFAGLAPLTEAGCGLHSYNPCWTTTHRGLGHGGAEQYSTSQRHGPQPMQVACRPRTEPFIDTTSRAVD
ncbi:hypothetical protein CspHIS471_0506900 [Cutaneotrichosporon sp. HIS471]|nr:hypothetical protein CspHIS471_0506900 [Cutaneotrichosporon sp. HIS471]